MEKHKWYEGISKQALAYSAGAFILGVATRSPLLKAAGAAVGLAAFVGRHPDTVIVPADLRNLPTNELGTQGDWPPASFGQATASLEDEIMVFLRQNHSV